MLVSCLSLSVGCSHTRPVYFGSFWLPVVFTSEEYERGLVSLSLTGSARHCLALLAAICLRVG